jgi:regulator of cell morphogenesis and NO signaling
MSTITLNQTIGELVTERPSRSRVFERRGIDYCCGGKVSLKDACEKKGFDPSAILAEIAEADEATRNVTQKNWSQATASELIENIVTTHHAYLKEELPRLSALTEKVALAHGERHPEMIDVKNVFEELRAELESHLMKEERILFPLCRELETAATLPDAHCGTVRNPIRVMEHEHDNAGNALEKLRALTNGYAPPQDACNTFRATLDGLKTLEEDLHVHIHKENSILFPRAIEIEERLSAG